MPIWKITPTGPVPVRETGLRQEKLLKEHLENWVIADPALPGEPLLITGQQVMILNVKDHLGIPALDPH